MEYIPQYLLRFILYPIALIVSFPVVGLSYIGSAGSDGLGHISTPIFATIISVNIIYWIGIISLFRIIRNKTLVVYKIPLLISLLLPLSTYFISYNHGDFIGRGFPDAFFPAVWGMGYEYSFNLIAYIKDVIFFFGCCIVFWLFYYYLFRLNLFKPGLSLVKKIALFLILVLVVLGYPIDLLRQFIYNSKIDFDIATAKEAFDKKDYAICEKLGHTDYQSNFNRENCLYKIAIALQDENGCMKISNKTQCLQDLITMKKDPVFCEKVSAICDTCITKCAIEFKNPLLCNKSNNPEGCFRGYNQTAEMKIIKYQNDYMEPTYKEGALLYIQPGPFHTQDLKRGDIIAYKISNWQSGTIDWNYQSVFVHRIIGLPNEHIQIKENKIYVNDQPLDEPYIAPDVVYKYKWYGGKKDITLRDNEFYVLGDNREPIDLGSIQWGGISIDQITGKVISCISGCSSER